MFDSFSRRIDYLRVSVTDLCNLRCAYCMPGGGVRKLPRAQILTFEEIERFVRVAVADFGICKVRLTGGEPLVRRDLAQLVRRLAAVPGLRDLAMTTNGTLLPRFAREELREAGLQRVNVSLDSVDPERFREITRDGDLATVFAGIEAARAAGLSPVKLNCVVERSSDEPDARAVAAWARERGLEARFIPRMELETGRFGVVEGGSGGDCASCNRLRLTADGRVLPCLMSDLSLPVRELGASEALRQAIARKPARGTGNRSRAFHRIGG